MKTMAIMTESLRRLGPAVAACLALGLSALAAAGELAVLHRVLAQDAPSREAQPLSPCRAPAGQTCLPGFGPQAPLAAPTASRIGLEMTDCRTGCPAFTAIISADGSFTYVGEANVERLGEHTGRVDVAGLRQVLRLADEVSFQRLGDTYASQFLDGPSSYVMVEWPRETKVVRADGGIEPAGFWAIRELLRGLLASADWDD